jgi:hypothetical protein
MLKKTLTFLMILKLLLFASVTAAIGSEPGSYFDHSAYADVLSQYVDNNGMVNYEMLKASPDKLNGYLNQIAKLDFKRYSSWDDNAKIAFWINAYNAFTLKIVIDHYPIKPSVLNRWIYPKNSIRQIPGVWDKIRFVAVQKGYTLEQIEHEILRKQFDEPLIHMALVCASIGCPQLRQEPYGQTKNSNSTQTPRSLLTDQLQEQAIRFLQSSNNFRVNFEKEILFISPILKWFADDFVPPEQRKKMSRAEIQRHAVLKFISNHLPPGFEDFHAIQPAVWTIQYLDYDWSLNEQQKK